MVRVSIDTRHFRTFLIVFSALLGVCLTCFGQSLGDVARENREKKESEASTTPPKVITNANLPKDPDADSGNNTEESTQPTTRKNAASSKHAAERRAAEHRAAEQWKQKILAQEATVSNLRSRVDRLQASIHFSSVSTYENQPYNRYQARQMERLAQLQQQLDQQKRKLEDMQEAARKAGMHTPVYDP
jgi:predicted RNase H-like nuclease (RuvC/YqgF family)